MSGLKKYSYLAYVGPLWILGLTMDKSGNPDVRYHCNQGIVLFIFELITLAIYITLGFIPMVGELLSVSFGFIVFPVCLLYMIVGWLNVHNCRTSPLPYIGLIKIIR